MEQEDYKNLQSLIAKGEELAERRPSAPASSRIFETRAKTEESLCYEWFLESEELIKKLVGEKTKYYKDFVSLSEPKSLTVLPYAYPNPGSEYGTFTYKFLKPEMKNQVAILKAILSSSQKSNFIDNNTLAQRFDMMNFHIEVVRHGRQPFIESTGYSPKRSISVKECLTAYDKFIKNISRIDDTGKSLMSKAFSFEKGKIENGIGKYPIVQVSPLTSENGRNFQDGIKFLAMGLMVGIRNLHLHNTAIDDELDVDYALHILSIISFIWKSIDQGITRSLAESSSFNESKQIANVFKEARDYYKNLGISYPSVEDKNKLIKNCITNGNISSGYSCRPIIISFLKEEKEFILGSDECTLSEEQKVQLQSIYEFNDIV